MRLIITTPDSFTAQENLQAHTIAVHSAEYWRQQSTDGQDWCQDAILSYKKGFVTSTTRTKNGFSAKIWRRNNLK